MDFQAKQTTTHNVHAKFREFYPGNRVLVKDLRKEDTWWPGSVAERSGMRRGLSNIPTEAACPPLCQSSRVQKAPDR